MKGARVFRMKERKGRKEKNQKSRKWRKNRNIGLGGKKRS